MKLDEVDRAILHALQQDARGTTAEELGAVADVSPSTVRNRIEKLEENGVIQGYYPHINYEQAGYQPHVFIICRAPPAKRSDLAKAALEIDGTIHVREMLSGANNLHIEAVAKDSDAVDRISAEITDIGLEIVGIDVIKAEYTQPFDHFGATAIDGDSDE